MRGLVKNYYGESSSSNERHETPAKLLSLADLQKTDYFKIL